MGLLELLGLAPQRMASIEREKRGVQETVRTRPAAQDFELQSLMDQLLASKTRQAELFDRASDVLSEQALCDALCEALDQSQDESDGILEGCHGQTSPSDPPGR